MKSQWDREGIDDRLKELVEVEKLSFAWVASKINKEFGTSFSRSAVIARAHRRGLNVPEDRRKNLAKHQRVNGGALTRALVAKIVRQEPEPLPPAPVIDEEIPIKQRKTLFELTSQTCRWPVGEGADLFFCGALPVPAHPYCAGHLARAYSKPHRVTDDGRQRMAFAHKRPSVFGQAA